MKFVAFIRNVMIGRKGLARELLLETFGRCGATNASSFLATGNVIFEVDATEADEIVSRVSQELLARIDLREPMFVRRLEALRALAARGLTVALVRPDGVLAVLLRDLPRDGRGLPAMEIALAGLVPRR